VILAAWMSHLMNALGSTTFEGWLMATGLLVRLRPESADAYPEVPAGVWLAAHRRDGDEGVVWLDALPAGKGAEALPLFEGHLEIRERVGGA
jgi:hypothetical protein